MESPLREQRNSFPFPKLNEVWTWSSGLWLRLKEGSLEVFLGVSTEIDFFGEKTEKDPCLPSGVFPDHFLSLLWIWQLTFSCLKEIFRSSKRTYTFSLRSLGLQRRFSIQIWTFSLSCLTSIEGSFSKISFADLGTYWLFITHSKMSSSPP